MLGETFATCTRDLNSEEKQALDRLVRDQVSARGLDPTSPPVRSVLEAMQNQTDKHREGRTKLFSLSDTELRRALRKRGQALDFLLHRYRYKTLPLAETPPPLPVIVYIEPTSVCNIRCTMCFQTDEELSKKIRGFMSFDLFSSIIDEVSKDISAVVFASRGEPFLHQQLPDMVRYCKAAGMLDIKINTNGTIYKEEYIKRLLQEGPDLLVFSIDSAVPEVFNDIRKGADFDKVVQNLRKTVELRESLGAHDTTVRVSMVEVRKDQAIEESKEFFLQIADEVSVKPVVDRLYIYNMELVPVTKRCQALWERVYIWYDGTVNPCDEDYLSNLKLGKLGGTTSLREIWNSATANRYREFHGSGKKNCLSPCDRCQGI